MKETLIIHTHLDLWLGEKKKLQDPHDFGIFGAAIFCDPIKTSF